MALYTHNGKLWGENENHGMTEVLAPFELEYIISILYLTEDVRDVLIPQNYKQYKGQPWENGIIHP